MCVEVVFTTESGPMLCENIGELEHALGGTVLGDEQMRYEGVYPRHAHCLCNVDLERTAAKFGLTIVHHGEASPYPYGTVELQAHPHDAAG